MKPEKVKAPKKMKKRPRKKGVNDKDGSSCMIRSLGDGFTPPDWSEDSIKVASSCTTSASDDAFPPPDWSEDSADVALEDVGQTCSTCTHLATDPEYMMHTCAAELSVCDAVTLEHSQELDSSCMASASKDAVPAPDFSEDFADMALEDERRICSTHLLPSLVVAPECMTLEFSTEPYASGDSKTLHVPTSCAHDVRSESDFSGNISDSLQLLAISPPPGLDFPSNCSIFDRGSLPSSPKDARKPFDSAFELAYLLANAHSVPEEKLKELSRNLLLQHAPHASRNKDVGNVDFITNEESCLGG
jgi:hypothetical protein